MTDGPASRTATVSLVIDACELVVEFLGASKDCARLGATCREWRVHVLHSRVWCEPLRALAPVTCRRLLQDERTQYEQHGAFRYRARWYSEYAAARQAKPTQCFFTNLPEARRTVPPVPHGRVQAAFEAARRALWASAPRDVCVIGFPGSGTATIVSHAGTPLELSPGHFMHMHSHDPARNIASSGGTSGAGRSPAAVAPSLRAEQPVSCWSSMPTTAPASVCFGRSCV
jgi:hypothetical protein